MINFSVFPYSFFLYDVVTLSAAQAMSKSSWGSER